MNLYFGGAVIGIDLSMIFMGIFMIFHGVSNREISRIVGGMVYVTSFVAYLFVLIYNIYKGCIIF